MSTFYGTLKSERKTTVSKAGISMLTSHTRTWDHGIEVTYKRDGKDTAICEIWKTGGSNNPSRVKLIKRFEVVAKNIRPGNEFYDRPIGGDEVTTV